MSYLLRILYAVEQEEFYKKEEKNSDVLNIHSDPKRDFKEDPSDIIIPGLSYGIDDSARCPDEKLRNISRYELIPSSCVLPRGTQMNFVQL